VSNYEPTSEQRAIVNSRTSALVIAGPGRGKTVTAIAAARAWLTRMPDSAQVLFTSFSNAAVRRVAEAAGIDLAGLGRRVRFRTFHSVAMEILRDYGRYVGLRRPAKPLDRTEEYLIAGERGWDQTDEKTYGNALRALAQDEGLVAFELMVPLAISLLRTSRTIRRAVGSRYPFIIIDEFQDTRADQWALVKLLGEHSRVLALGDPNQMIYECDHQAARRRMEDFCRWKGIQPTSFDGPNFRCRIGEVVRFAESLLLGRKHIATGNDGVQLLSVYPKQRRATLAALWSKIRRQTGKESSIAFIVPSNAAARELAAELREPDPTNKVPIPIYAHVEDDEASHDAFRLAACAAADWVLSRTEDRLRALAVALAVFLTTWSRRKLTSARIARIEKLLRPDSKAVSPLRDYLTSPRLARFAEFAVGLLAALEMDKEFARAAIALRRRGIPNIRDAPLGEGTMFQDYRLARTGTGLQGMNISPAPTTVLSMYRSKGREFDFAVLVVEPRRHSSKVSVDELRRLYYVSATRAREWLGVLYSHGRPGPVLGPVLSESFAHDRKESP